MSQDDVIPKVRNHKQSGAGIGDVAGDDVHVDYSHRKRGFILRRHLQVDLAAVAGCRRQAGGDAINGGVGVDRRHHFLGSQLKTNSWKP
jgi:hypothetical protein